MVPHSRQSKLEAVFNAENNLWCWKQWPVGVWLINITYWEMCPVSCRDGTFHGACWRWTLCPKRWHFPWCLLEVNPLSQEMALSMVLAGSEPSVPLTGTLHNWIHLAISLNKILQRLQLFNTDHHLKRLFHCYFILSQERAWIQKQNPVQQQTKLRFESEKQNVLFQSKKKASVEYDINMINTCNLLRSIRGQHFHPTAATHFA